MQDKVKDIIAKYLGKPYKHGGRTLEGLDCWGLAISIYKDIGFDLWDINEAYDESFNWRERNYFIENYHKEWAKVDIPAVFDGILFHNKSGLAVHGGIMLDDIRFIHSVKGIGVIISRLDTTWKNKLEGFYRLKVRDNGKA